MFTPTTGTLPISPWVERFAPRVAADQPLLDLAAGNGRHGRFFLARQHPVTFVDRNISQLTDLQPLSQATVIAADLEDGSPWPLESERFAAVVVVNYLHRPLFPQLLNALAPGGLLIYETFALGNEAYGRPRNPAFLLRPGELLDAVASRLEVVAYEHGLVHRPTGDAVMQRICAVA